MTDGTGWLVMVAMVTAVNPLRLQGRLPDPRVVALGAGASAGLYLVLAAVAGALSDAIDVSGPTMAVAAGLVLIIGAARDLLVGPPAAQPALPGWGAALVPVAAPMLTRPQVGVLALSAGADEGIGVVALGAAMMVGVATLTSGRMTPVAERVVGWSATLAAIVTVVIGVALAIDGVLSV